MNIILFSHYNTDKARLREILVERWKLGNIEEGDFTRFEKVDSLKFLKYLRNLNFDIAVSGVYDIRTQQELRLWKAVVLVTKASYKLLIDQNGIMQRISWARFLLLDVPHVIIELLFAPFILAKHWLKIKYEKSRIEKVGKLLKKKSDKLKLAYLRTTFSFNLKAGGSVGHTAGVISGFTELGSDVFCVSNDELFGVDKTCVPIHIVYTCKFLNTFIDLSQLAYNTKFIKSSIKILSKEKPDLIYQRYNKLNYSGVILARRLNIPFVLEFNSSEVWGMKYWAKRKNRLLSLVQKVEMLNLIAADLVVVVSEPLRKDLIEFGMDEKKILVNPNGVDPERFNPQISKSQRTRKLKQELEINKNKVIVGFTGTFGPWHGIPQLTEAIDEILGNRLHSNIHFLLVGDGQLKTSMEKQIGHYENVTFTGQVPYSDVQYYLAICDIFVSPHNQQVDGREFFGSPTKMYEYMAMGKGIVASNLGQIGQVLENEKTAILVEPGNVKELIDAILRLAEDEELRERLGLNAREKVVAEHTWKRNVERVVEALSKL